MNPILARNLFFVKEKVGMFKAVNEYEILDPETQDVIMTTEEKIGTLTKLFRFTDFKVMTPFNVIVRDAEGNQILRVAKGVSFLRSKVLVHDDGDQLIGMFQQKLWAIGGKFQLQDTTGAPVGMLKGNWKSWEFTFEDLEENKIAMVTKKWAGLGKELFTSADNYILSVEDIVPEDSPVRCLILAAVVCIDMVLKE